MKIIGIGCQNYNRAIGKNNNLLFKLKKDMNFFKNKTINVKNITKKNAVLMGSNTYFSIPKKYRPLDKRINIIISKNRYDEINKDIKINKLKNTFVFSDIDQSIQFAHVYSKLENLYVIGGESIYNEFIKRNIFDKIYLSEIQSPKFNFGDTFFPKLENFKYTNLENYIEKDIFCYPYNKILPEIKYSINSYSNLNKDTFNIESNEDNYLNLLENVLKYGEKRETRNSVTFSKFGLRMEFDISKYFPLLTTKKVYWKGVVNELLWFLNSNTYSPDLEKKGVNIWKQNTSKEYFDKIGLEKYEEGWGGPIYGFQWRHFNAEYKTPFSNYKNQGIDQLQECLNLIQNNPKSRRIFMSAWNPCQLKEMALPPCHISYQFYVTNDNKIDCQMYQRSGDLFLGIPFNIASTALLVNIISKNTNYKPGRIILNIGDAHIYENHIEQVKTQLQRQPYKFPILNILNKKDTIENYQFEDFSLLGYEYHPVIKADMIA